MEHIGESILIPSALGAVDTLVLQTEHMILGWGFDGNLTKLHENLITIQSVLSDAENRKLRFTEQWLMKLKSVINGAEILMVELKYEAARRKIEVRNWMRNKVRDFFSLSNPLAFRLKMIHKVNDINLLIKEIREQANGIRLRPSEDNHAIVRSSTFIDDSEIMERDWDVCRLKDMLLGSGTDSELDYGLPVIAIVGIPTVGKTALVQLVYNDSEVVKNFRANRKWICVSTGFKLERLLSEMVQFLTRVNGKRYLLVLDDVLNIEGDQWEQMMNALLRIDGSEGSRIMVTTRSIEVVLTMRIPPFLIHQLSPLTEDRSWTMFRSIAFAAGGPRPTQSLIEIGRKFLPKCKGIPLVIKSVASLLYLSHDESAWMSIYNNENLSFVPNEPGVLEKFRLTFNELPSPSLKQCFAYCAVFPKGHNIKTDELIQLWTSLGYLHPNLERNLEMEDVGNYNCKVLMEKSLLESVEMDEYKNITSYKIPNDVHDLAVQIYEGYHLTLEPNGRKYHTVADHLSLDFCEEKGIDIPKGNVEMLTALLPQIGVNVNHTLAFGLFGDDVEKLPNSICKFLLLTYLDLSETSITKLPKFITKFYNLQTLKLPMHLIELPKQFHKLVSLRHFCMPNASQTRKLMPMKIGRLTCLQTLPFFVVGEGSDQRIKELGSLTKLRGRLHVYDLQRVKGKEEAKQANISEKSCIQELGFHWDSNAALEQNTNTINQEHVLDGLQPHSNIRGLILKNFGGQSFPSWMRSINGPLQNLVKIELMDCSLCEQVPSLGHLPCLEIIEMVGLGNLKHIDPGFYGYNDGQAGAFLSLRKLTLDGMPMLKKWSLPDGTSRTEFFPCLKELYISDCPQLVAIPTHLFSIQEMTISSLSLSDVESAKTYHPSLTICSACKNSELLDSVLGDLLEKSSKPLRSLTIRGLNELSYLPNNLSNLTSLEKLEIIECSGLISVIEDPKGFNGLTSLQQLSIKRCPKLTRLSEGLVLQTLVTFEIDSCPSLGQVELGSLTSLQNLMIKGCPGLVSCWKEKLLNMTSLQKLEIGAFSKELDYFPWPSTNAVVSAGNANVDSDIQPYASTSAFIAAAKQPQLFSFMDLRSLGLWGWEKLDCLPEVLQHLTTLTELSIHLFHSLEALPDWLANLSSLQSLELHNCKNLAVLPKKSLLQLRQLTIGNCPLLGKRCGKRTGAEWAKIAHIPSVKFSFSAEELTVVLPEVK